MGSWTSGQVGSKATTPKRRFTSICVFMFIRINIYMYLCSGLLNVVTLVPLFLFSILFNGDVFQCIKETLQQEDP